MAVRAREWPSDWRTKLRVRGQALLAPLLARRADVGGRRVHAFALGLPRSGTHSLAGMFDAEFRAAHEPALVDTIAHVMSWNRGERSRGQMGALLRWRDRRLGLELEAAHYLHHVAPLLVEEFPAARFVLTVRDPLSWLSSEINQNLRSAAYPFWQALERQRYGRYGHAFPPAEQRLSEVGGLHPLASYLTYWREHVHGVLEAVPAERLLVLRTDELDDRLPELAAFCGVDLTLIDRSRVRAGVGHDPRLDLRESVDLDHVRSEITRYCGDLASRWFPEYSA